MRTTVAALVLLQAAVVFGQAVDEHTMAYWKLDEGAGDTARDSSPNGNDGTLENAVWTQGKAGTALEFDGQTARVVVPDSPSLHSQTGDLTIEAWIKVASDPTTWSNAGPMVFKQDAYQWAVNSNGALWFGIWGARLESIGTYEFQDHVDEWHHATITFDGATQNAQIYVDGELNIEGTVSEAVDPTTTELYIGYKGDGGTYFDGIIDEVRISDVVRTQEEIQGFMLSGGEPYPKAFAPSPKNGTVIDVTFTFLEWVPGDFATSHLVYFGEDFDDVNDGSVDPIPSAVPSVVIGMTPPYTTGLIPGQTYYWRVDEVNDADPASPWKGDVWSFRVRPDVAWNPSPADGVAFVDPNGDLAWENGLGTLFHTVYFGESFDEVNDATAGGIMITDPTYDPGPMAFDTTYYWRVDEFAGVETTRGDVWSFTTLPDVAVSDPDLVAWYTLDEGEGTTAVDWSGHGHHTKLVSADWVPSAWLGDAALRLSGYGAIRKLQYDANDITAVTACAWIQTSSPSNQYIVSFDRNEYYRLEINGDGAGPGQVGWDVMTSTGQVDYGSLTRVDDGQWHHVCGVFDNGTMTIYIDGQPEPSVVGGPVMGSDNIRFGFLGANSEAVTFDGTRGAGTPVSGLMDDVRIYHKALTQEEIQAIMRPDPQLAWQPSPGSGATTDITRAVPLAWQTGTGAAQHDVYLGSDRDAVLEADATDTTGIYRGRQGSTSYSPATPLEWGQEYFWRVDEVAADGSVTSGAVWSFTLTDYLIVDEFESYTNDSPNRVFQTWVDGLGFSADEFFPDGHPGNGSGAIVGYDPLSGNIMEMTTVHDGGQSMPIEYDNSMAPGYSEALRTFSPAQDWTREGVTTLVVHFRGADGNTGQPYVKINGTKIPYPGDASDVASPTWIAWEIDLASVGVTRTNVTEMAVGVEGGTAGLLYVDSIRLLRP